MIMQNDHDQFVYCNYYHIGVLKAAEAWPMSIHH